MKIYQELKDAIAEELNTMEESNEFCSCFSKLLENYMYDMKDKADIVDVIMHIADAEESDGN